MARPSVFVSNVSSATSMRNTSCASKWWIRSRISARAMAASGKTSPATSGTPGSKRYCFALWLFRRAPRRDKRDEIPGIADAQEQEGHQHDGERVVGAGPAQIEGEADDRERDIPEHRDRAVEPEIGPM